MSEIQTREPIGTFLYFLIATCLLATIGAKAPFLAQNVGDIMQEHIAGKTIYVFAGTILLLAFLCAIRNIFSPGEYGAIIKYLVINPSNFVITLAFVAAAINWGVALSTYLLFPLVARGEVFTATVQNALQISAIAIVLAAVAWALHVRPSGKKTAQPFSGADKIAFWVVFAASTVFWLSFFATLVAKAVGA